MISVKKSFSNDPCRSYKPNFVDMESQYFCDEGAFMFAFVFVCIAFLLGLLTTVLALSLCLCTFSLLCFKTRDNLIELS